MSNNDAAWKATVNNNDYWALLEGWYRRVQVRGKWPVANPGAPVLEFGDVDGLDSADDGLRSAGWVRTGDWIAAATDPAADNRWVAPVQRA